MVFCELMREVRKYRGCGDLFGVHEPDPSMTVERWLGATFMETDDGLTVARQARDSAVWKLLWRAS